MPYIGRNHIAGDHTSNFKVLDDISSYTATFDGSATAVVSTSNETLRIPQHRFIQGQRVTYNNGGGSNIGGLTSGTAYFVTFDTANTIKLATSLANANSNTNINLSSVGGGTSHTLNAAFDGTNTKFKLTHNSGDSARLNNATQLQVAINNVLQRPNNNSNNFSEGFAIESGNKIVFKTAPTVNDVFWGSIIANTIETFDLTDHTIDNFTGDGSTTTFTLSKDVPNIQSLLVTLDGVTQHSSDVSTSRSYSLVSSNAILFTSAPGNGVEIQVKHLGFAGASTGGVSGFYGRTGNVTLTSSDHITTGDITSRNINSSGIVTASSFIGDGSGLIGVASTDNIITGTAATFNTYPVDINAGMTVAGVSTFGAITATSFGAVSGTTGTFSGNVSIGGTLTYEDVTNIDSVGIITAQKDIHVGAGLSVVGVTTFSDDVTLTGVSGGASGSAIWDKSDKSLNIGNNAYLKLGSTSFGSGQQLQIYQSGSSGFAIFRSLNNNKIAYHNDKLYFNNQANNTALARIESDEGVSLYYTGTKRLQTSGIGVTVTGTVVATGADVNGDLDVDGNTDLDNVNIAGVTTHYDQVYVRQTGSTNSTNVMPLWVQAFKGATTGITTTLYESSFGLRPEFIFSNSHNGNWNNSAGQTQHWRMLWRAPNETDTTDDVVELKPYTNITGALSYFSIKTSNNTSGLVNSANFSSQSQNFYANNSFVLTMDQVGLGITDSIYHYGDTDTKIRFPANDTIRFVTAGSQRLNINSSGTVSITNDLDVDGHTNLDNVSIAGVTTATGNITISSSHPKLLLTDNSDPDFSVHVNDSAFHIRNETVNRNDFRITSDGTNELYHGGSKKFETTSYGAAVTGGINFSGDSLVQDNVSIFFGASNDLQIVHDGTNSIIDTNTGDLILRGDSDDVKILAEDDIVLRDNDDSTNFIHCVNGGGVKLYNNGTQMFETYSSGVTISGGQVNVNPSSGNATLQLKSGSGSVYTNIHFKASDNTQTSYITSWSGGNLYFNTTSALISSIGGTEITEVTSTGFHPKTDSARDLGKTGTRWANAYVDTYYGDGSNLTGITGTTINNNADNRVITGSGSANTLNGESNVIIDSSGRLLIGTTTEGHPAGDKITVADSGNAGITIRSGTTSNGALYFSDGTSGAAEYRGGVVYHHDGNYLRFYTNGTERFRIDAAGQVLPGTDDSQNLGSSSKRWANIYAADMHFSNKGKTNDVDGTWGDWTLQEGEDSVYMINNRTGKKYAITMKEVN